MNETFPEPTHARATRAEVFLDYLDYFRGRLLHKVADLPEEDLRSSRLPSGWTPLQMVKHLTFVERRWLEWGFEGHSMPEPWGDEREGRWFVSDEENVDELTQELVMQGASTRTIVNSHRLDEPGRPGPRWAGEPPATLERILLHLIQEYARHLGHMDVVVELAAGSIGE